MLVVEYLTVRQLCSRKLHVGIALGSQYDLRDRGCAAGNRIGPTEIVKLLPRVLHVPSAHAGGLLMAARLITCSGCLHHTIDCDNHLGSVYLQRHSCMREIHE